MRGFEGLRRAKERLDGPEGIAREKLRNAVYEFVVAASERESWPIGLRIETERVRAGLLVHGVMDGDDVDLDDSVIVALTEDLRGLCEKAERAYAARRGSAPRGREPAGEPRAAR